LPAIPAQFWQLDLSNYRWCRKKFASYETNKGQVGFTIGSKAYIGLGQHQGLSEYDLATETWKGLTRYPGTDGDENIAFTIGSKIYVASPNTSQNKTDFYEYDPALNVWTKKADVPVRYIARGVAFSIGSKGYLGIGHAGIEVNELH